MKSEYTIVKQMYAFVFTVSVMLFMFFILLNYDSLDEITFIIPVSGTDFELEVNFYAILGVMVLMFVIVILMSLSILGSGLNDEGSKNLGKMIVMFTFYGFFIIIDAYFILPFGFIGSLVILVFSVIFVFNGLVSLVSEG